MQCPICKNGETHAGFANMTLARDGAVFLVKQVPAEICDNCGEEYIAESETQSVLLQVSRAASKGVQLDVREYLAA